MAKKTSKKTGKAKVHMTVARAPFGEEARALVSCDELDAFLRELDSLSPEGMRRALIDLGVHLAARRIREEAA